VVNAAAIAPSNDNRFNLFLLVEFRAVKTYQNLTAFITPWLSNLDGAESEYVD